MIPGTLIKRFRVVVISANQFEAKASTKVISEIRLAGHKFTKKPYQMGLRGKQNVTTPFKNKITTISCVRMSFYWYILAMTLNGS